MTLEDIEVISLGRVQENIKDTTFVDTPPGRGNLKKKSSKQQDKHCTHAIYSFHFNNERKNHLQPPPLISDPKKHLPFAQLFCPMELH